MTRKKPEHQEPDAPRTGGASDSPTAGPVDGETELDALRRERDDLMARLQRVSADYLNYQKRLQRDSLETTEHANAELLKALLPILDDMERVLAAAKANHGQDDPLYTGMQLVHNKALETLGKFGLSVIEALGRDFDPDKHAAVAQQPSEQYPPQTVIEEMAKGYQFKGRTIRPSRVVVSTCPADETGGEPSPADEQRLDQDA